MIPELLAGYAHTLLHTQSFVTRSHMVAQTAGEALSLQGIKSTGMFQAYTQPAFEVHLHLERSFETKPVTSLSSDPCLCTHNHANTHLQCSFLHYRDSL